MPQARAQDAVTLCTVAALYIDPRGPYPRMPGVECWDERRDARAYAGPLPVVAHPPCGPWGALRHLYRGREHGCALRAVEQVRQFGGVLEHPARSALWAHCALPARGELDAFGGFAVEVDQCAWGHVARKRTWLYMVRVPRALVAATMRTGGTPTHWASGRRDCKTGGSVPAGIKVCSAEQRRRSPPLFAEWLVMLARSGRGLSC